LKRVESMSNIIDLLTYEKEDGSSRAMSFTDTNNALTQQSSEEEHSSDVEPVSIKRDDASSKSLELQEDASSVEITDAEAMNTKGMNLVRIQELRSALECFEQALRLNPNHSKAWYNKGMCLVSLGESKEGAMRCFEKAIEINPLDAEAWNNKGAVLAMLEQDQDAMVCYERALELKPSLARAWQNKGLVLWRIGNKKAAKQCFKNAIDAGLK
jgi:tetratricopeptide (TPR) repeat protein